MNALLTLPSILLFVGTCYSKISSVYIDFQVWYFIFTNLFQYIMLSIVIENMSIISICFNAISAQPFAEALEYARTCYISRIFMLNDD
jgi:hypothetical protein